jgi:regulator of protease activity HflC (stomatin/prohibitin superfamily)
MKYQRGNAIVVVITLVSIAILGLLFFGLPAWNVWRRGLSGEAQLREAEWNRQITVQEAKAKLESATMLAGAEVERAKGVAQANEIIAEGLQGHDEYLRYLWIQALEHTATQQGGQVIYVPTEANLPILEAQRLK